MFASTTKSMLFALTFCLAIGCALAVGQLEQKPDEPSRARMLSPFSFARLFAPFSSAQAGELQAQGYKRSSSMDPLSGIIIGKRNPSPAPAGIQLVGVDPWYASMRHSAGRLMPRLYDLHWDNQPQVESQYEIES